MAMMVGFRKTKVIDYTVDQGDVVIDDYRGGYVYIEVTNDTASTVYFKVNHINVGGHKGADIPIKAGTTRVIPVALFTFSCTGDVTVVAYGM